MIGEAAGEGSVLRTEVAVREHDAVTTELAPPRTGTQLAIAGSGLLFSILQSVCTAVVAINGVRLLIGVGALAMTAGLGSSLERFHQITWLRITFLVGALFGSIFTLAVVLHARHLRNRPAARWRLIPLTAHQRRMEALQLFLSVLTLILVAVEEYLHFQLCHTL